MELELSTGLNGENESGVNIAENKFDGSFPLLSEHTGDAQAEAQLFAPKEQKEPEWSPSGVVSRDERFPSQSSGDKIQWRPEHTEDEAPLLMKADECSTLKNKDAADLRNGIIASSDGIKDMELKCAAYVRHDMYGTMGKGDISIWEKALLVLALMIVVPIKVVLLLGILIVYYVICRVCTLFKSPLQDEGQENYAYLTGWRRSIIVCCGRFLARAILFVLGFFRIKVIHKDSHHPGLMNKGDCKGEGRSEEDNQQPGAIISNHVSYLDILYHMSASFPSFVAKRSVAKLPLVGLMSKCLGCLYVQREAKSSSFKGVSGMVAGRLEAAHSDKYAPVMMLFPEGTTTNGDFLLPFKTGAFLSKTPVQPVILKYPYRRFNPAWDTISGIRHLILLLCQFVNHLEVVWLPVYIPSEKEKLDPKLYANNVRTLMAAEGNLTLSNIGLYEKRIYHAALNGKELLDKLHGKFD